jgi:hypothetical protein
MSSSGLCSQLLANEINRAPAKVQSALLEVMQERQVTIGKQTFPVPDPFLVLATQNPIESEGTYPLPEAQIDRFMLKVLVDYPAHDEELTVVARSLENPPSLQPVLSLEELLALQRQVREVYVDPALTADCRHRNRDAPAAQHHLQSSRTTSFGASPRGPISVAAARALAIRGRDVIPADLLALVRDAFHRLALRTARSRKRSHRHDPRRGDRVVPMPQIDLGRAKVGTSRPPAARRSRPIRARASCGDVAKRCASLSSRSRAPRGRAALGRLQVCVGGVGSSSGGRPYSRVTTFAASSETSPRAPASRTARRLPSFLVTWLVLDASASMARHRRATQGRRHGGGGRDGYAATRRGNRLT